MDRETAWERLEVPLWWPEAGRFVIGDRHLADGRRQHLVMGTVPAGTAIAEADVIGADDGRVKWRGSSWLSGLSHTRPDGMKTGAALSPCGRYRYALWRRWDPAGKYAVFIGLNPSTADAEHDDPTIKRCIDFAKRWGYSGLAMVNLFAFRATQPKDMMAAKDPVGPDNDKWLQHASKDAGVVVAAWGAGGGHLGRDQEVARMFQGHLMALKKLKGGRPGHPLYVSGETQLQRWP